MTTKTKTKINQASHHKLTGDIFNVSILATSVVYVITVVYFTMPGAAQGVVDEEWKKDGFCIQNSDVPYWSSFDTCLYVDVVFSAIIAGMYFAWKDIPGMEASSAVVPALIAATLGHGIAHGLTAVKLRDGTYHTQHDEGDAAPTLLQMTIGCVFFWCPLLKASMPKMKYEHVAVLAAIVTYGQSFVKNKLGFAYIQTIVNISVHVSQLMLSPDEKNRREYMTMPLSNVLPLMVAWNEVLFCDPYFRLLGGHVLYDASIVVSFMVYYFDCYSFHTTVVRSSSTSTSNKSVTKEKAT